MRLVDTNNQIELFDIKRNRKITFSNETYTAIKFICNSSIKHKSDKNEKYYKIADKLIDLNIFSSYEDIENQKLNIITSNNRLKSISLEITNKCNMQCLHCYGQFYKQPQVELDLNYIKKVCVILDNLGTNDVALTGGEFFMHSDFLKIFFIFADKDFRITIFTNGLLVERILDFVKITSGFYYELKISLDGFEKDHNQLRGSNESYKNILYLLDKLKKYPNITITISTIITKINYLSIDKFKKFIKNKYKYKHSTDIAFLTNKNTENKLLFFELDQFSLLKENIKNMFKNKTDNNLEEKKLRCRGGVDMATITYDKKLKICNGATDNIFYFGDISDINSLLKVWETPPVHIQRFRNEKIKDIATCSKCNDLEDCLNVNCRILANSLLGDHLMHNPINCLMVNEIEKP